MALPIIDLGPSAPMMMAASMTVPSQSRSPEAPIDMTRDVRKDVNAGLTRLGDKSLIEAGAVDDRAAKVRGVVQIAHLDHRMSSN